MTGYVRYFEYRTQAGGISFPCDRHGCVQLTDDDRDLWRKCLSGEINVIDRGVRKDDPDLL